MLNHHGQCCTDVTKNEYHVTTKLVKLFFSFPNFDVKIINSRSELIIKTLCPRVKLFHADESVPSLDRVNYVVTVVDELLDVARERFAAPVLGLVDDLHARLPDGAPTPSTLAQSKERKGSNFAA